MSCLNSSTTLFKEHIEHETNIKQNQNITSLIPAMFFYKSGTNITHGAFRHLEANKNEHNYLYKTRPLIKLTMEQCKVWVS